MKIYTLVLLSLIVIIVSVLLDSYSLLGVDKHWFQRSGAALVFLGAVFESKYIVRSADGERTSIPGGLGAIGGAENKDISRFSLGVLKRHAGFYFVLLGTLIWGYGDLFEPLFT